MPGIMPKHNNCDFENFIISEYLNCLDSFEQMLENRSYMYKMYKTLKKSSLNTDPLFFEIHKRTHSNDSFFVHKRKFVYLCKNSLKKIIVKKRKFIKL